MVVRVGGRMRWSYGAHGIHHPSATNCVNMVRNGVRATQNELSASARPSETKNDVRREGVRVGRFGWGIGSAIKMSCPSYLGRN